MKKQAVAEAYQTIRDEIIGGVTRSEQIILEQGVAERFGISKLAAREVLQRLCNDKYLKSFPRKGYLVTDITAVQLRKIQQVRYQLEALAIRLVIKRCGDEEIRQLYDIINCSAEGLDPHDSVSSRFHLKLAQLSGNEYIGDALYTYLGYTSRYALTAVFANRFSDYRAYHADLVHALLLRDVPAALEALRRDIMLGEKDV